MVEFLNQILENATEFSILISALTAGIFVAALFAQRKDQISKKQLEFEKVEKELRQAIARNNEANVRLREAFVELNKELEERGNDPITSKQLMVFTKALEDALK